MSYYHQLVITLSFSRTKFLIHQDIYNTLISAQTIIIVIWKYLQREISMSSYLRHFHHQDIFPWDTDTVSLLLDSSRNKIKIIYRLIIIKILMCKKEIKIVSVAHLKLFGSVFFPCKGISIHIYHLSHP